MRRPLVALFVLASLVLVQNEVLAQTGGKRGVTAEDYFSFETAGDPQISPDGKWVAYSVTAIDQKASRRVSRIWLAALDGSHPPVPFTSEGASSSSARWSPDGR